MFADPFHPYTAAAREMQNQLNLQNALGSLAARQAQGASARGGAAPGQSVSQSDTQMVPGMVNVYNQLLGLNQSNYQRMLGAYQQGQAHLSGRLPQVSGLYGSLSGDVMSTLGMGQVLGKDGNWGVAAPAAEAIRKQGVYQSGAATQQLTSAGLGNTTAAAQAQNQVAANTQSAYGQLGADLARQAAAYQAQIGLARAGAEMQGLGMQTGLTQYGMGQMNQPFSNTAGSLTGGSSRSSSQQYDPYYQAAAHGFGGGGGGGVRLGGGGGGSVGGYAVKPVVYAPPPPPKPKTGGILGVGPVMAPSGNPGYHGGAMGVPMGTPNYGSVVTLPPQFRY